MSEDVPCNFDDSFAIASAKLRNNPYKKKITRNEQQYLNNMQLYVIIVEYNHTGEIHAA